ncbi:SLC13 family permease [Rhizobium halophytocola]|uniref:Di/tricarboxylate transporter n=1 Tax=Rhizobium halophytocola TaxID=735519 RepID=A0ABS4DWT0_9HYPH|nr:SLC13 family permease [Rhizobium halophytocola]MBP1850155.1 di/tricarboxylate transporter [Rhizobium halophytocola]
MLAASWMPDTVMLSRFLDDHSALIGLVVLLAMLVGFIREKTPPAAIAAMGASLFIALGFVKPDQALGVFSNPAAITVGAMFVISAAVQRSGLMEAVISRMMELGRTRPKLAIGSLLALTMLASAFINSTPVVVMMIPVMISIASATGLARRKLLIPLSYCAILGGTCTLIGTSTNLLVDSIARREGLEGFGVFSITPIGLILMVGCALFLYLTQSFLLPDRRDGETAGGGEAKPDILTEVRIGPGFADIGRPYEKARLLSPRGVELVSVFRSGEKLNIASSDELMTERDRIVLRATQAELATLRTTAGLQIGVQVRASQAPVEKEEVSRVVIASGHRAIDRRIADAEFLSRMPLRVLGVSRRTNPAGPDLGGLRLKAGDSLWVAGSREALQSLRQDMRLLPAEAPLAKPFRRDRAALVLMTLAVVVTLASIGLLSISALAIIAVGFLFAIRAIDPSDAWVAMDGDVLALIFSMLIVGLGLENAGSVQAIISAVLPVLQQASPVVVVLSIYVLTSILTEMVTNNAVAVIMTPIAISLSDKLGLAPEATVLAVLFGASASFATPIGYQTNTLVASAGGYRFADFLRVGVAMNIIAACLTTAGIYLFYLR